MVVVVSIKSHAERSIPWEREIGSVTDSNDSPFTTKSHYVQRGENPFTTKSHDVQRGELPVECEVAVGRSHQRGSLTGHKPHQTAML